MTESEDAAEQSAGCSGSTAVTQFWVWLSERLFDAAMACEHFAIGRKTLAAYEAATDCPTAENVVAAKKALFEASGRLGHDNSAAHTVARCYHQISSIGQ